MNTKISKSSATVKVTHQEFAIIEKALEEYYWNREADYGDIRKCIRNMLHDMRMERALSKK